MTKASDNAFPSLLITEGTEPSAPAAGKQRLYVDSTTHLLMLTNSSGTETVVGAGTASDATVTFTDITTNNSSTTKHGFLKKLDNNASNFMNGQGNWAAPSGAAATGARYPVQTASVASASSNSRTVTFGTAPTNGNICFIASVSEGTDAITSITQTNVTWTSFLVASAGVAPVIELWKGVAAASAGTGAVIAYGASTFHSAVGMEWSGLAGTLSTSATRHVTTDPTALHPMPILTPASATDLLIAAVSSSANAATYSAFTGFGMVIVETGRTVGVAWGFPGANAAYGSFTGGSNATASGLTASIA